MARFIFGLSLFKLTHCGGLHPLALPCDVCANCAMRLTFFLVLLFLVSVTAHAASPQGDLPAALCERTIERAEINGSTPRGILAAIGQVESGRPDPQTGAMRPGLGPSTPVGRVDSSRPKRRLSLLWSRCRRTACARSM